MASVTNVIDLSTTRQILNVADRYIEIILYISGVCGALLNIFTFLQKQLRSNSCSMYFLAASCCDFSICNVFILPKIVSFFNLQGYQQFVRTRFWCKLGNYCIFMFPCLSSLYITCASIDRYCSSSRRAALRKVSSIKVSRMVVAGILVIWGLFSLHTAIAYDMREFTPNATTLTCSPKRNIYTIFLIIDGFFFALFNGAIIPFLLTLFGILIIHHVHQLRHRTAVIRPVRTQRTGLDSVSETGTGIPTMGISRANRHLITMLLIQVCLTVVLNLPYVVLYLNNLYNTVTVTPFYLTMSYMASWFYFLNYCKTFYVNTLSSQLFRSILKQQVLYLLRRTQTQLVATWSTSGHR